MTALLDPAPRADLPPRDDSLPADWPVDAAFSTSDVSATPHERSGYRRAHGSDPVAIIGALAVGLATIAAFATMNPRFKANDKREPTVVTLMELPDEPPPPAPPPSEPPPPDAPPPVARIVAPTPMVALPERPVLSAPPAVQPAATPAPPRPTPAVAPPAPENLGDLTARVTFRPTMRIPRESQRLREEGTVLLSVLLSPEGRVIDISLARSCGFPRLDRAALEYVRDWRWSPFLKNGQPVMVRGMVPIEIRGPRGGGRGRGGHGRRHDRFDDDRPPQVGDPV